MPPKKPDKCHVCGGTVMGKSNIPELTQRPTAVTIVNVFLYHERVYGGK